jgi:LPS-assembly lipoprotein
MTAASGKRQAASLRTRSAVFRLLLVACSLSLVSCGFQLRGGALSQFPAGLSTLRVEMTGRLTGSHDPLQLAMEAALRRQAGVTIVTTGQVPVLVLEPEQFGSSAISVTSAGRAGEVRVSLAVSFQLRDASGAVLLPTQTVRLQREYVYDPLNVVAKEREELDLKEIMRRDVAGQIVRRLARAPASPPAKRASEK